LVKGDFEGVVQSNHKKAVILNSRQGLRPYGNDPWIVNSHKAVMNAAARKCALLSSTGMKSWDMTLFLASKYKLHQRIYLPLENPESFDKIKSALLTEFELDDRLIDWIPIKQEDNDVQSLNHRRDHTIIDDADIIYPVSIRPGGNLDKLIAAARHNGKEIIDDFGVEYQDTSHRCRIKIDREEINSEIDNLFEDYVIHWTKATNLLWPGESQCDYYRAVIESESSYPRSGLQTLIRIITAGKLLPSERHYRKGFPAVAFSSLAPGRAVDLMKWRARYREMTIEPYGIAIHKDYADTIGVRKVFYGSPEMYDYLEDANKPYFQNIGIRGNWMPEKEYRHIGEIDLSFVPSDLMAVIVFRPQEVDLVRQVFDGCIYSLCK